MILTSLTAVVLLSLVPNARDTNEPRQIALFCAVYNEKTPSDPLPARFDVNVLLPHDEFKTAASEGIYTDDPSGLMNGQTFSRYDFKETNGKDSAALVTKGFPDGGHILVLSHKVEEGIFAAVFASGSGATQYLGKCVVMSIHKDWFFQKIKKSGSVQ